MNIQALFSKQKQIYKIIEIIGVLIGVILGVPEIIKKFSPSPTSDANNSAKVSRVAAVESLHNDLEKLKVILPVNQSFSDCMKKRKGDFKNLLEACAQERKLQGEDPQQIIEKHRASLRLHFSDEELEQIDEGLKSIKFFAYEMWNNQIGLEGWRANGCPSNVTVFNTEKARQFMQNHKLKSGCGITVDKYESFFERDSKNTNFITSIRGSENTVDNINYLVVPNHLRHGVHTTIEKFFFDNNNDMYSNMISDINTLTPLLKKLIEQ